MIETCLFVLHKRNRCLGRTIYQDDRPYLPKHVVDIQATPNSYSYLFTDISVVYVNKAESKLSLDGVTAIGLPLQRHRLKVDFCIVDNMQWHSVESAGAQTIVALGLKANRLQSTLDVGRQSNVR